MFAGFKPASAERQVYSLAVGTVYGEYSSEMTGKPVDRHPSDKDHIEFERSCRPQRIGTAAAATFHIGNKLVSTASS